MYRLYANARIKSSCHFVNHLPFLEEALKECRNGSPVHRALVSLKRTPPSAGAFAAYASAFKNRKERGAAHLGDFYLGGMSGIVLGLIADQNYPISRHDWLSLAIPALYFAATGEKLNFTALMMVEEDPETFMTGGMVYDEQDNEGMIHEVGDGILHATFGTEQRTYNFLGHNLKGKGEIRIRKTEKVK